jgi:CheY-like chemotaxis protein
MAKKILVVDDELDVLKVTTYRLKKAGYEVSSATDGKAALEEVRKNRPDFIFLDMRLPGMDGIDVCLLIKQDEALKNIPVVFLTASSDMAHQEKIEEAKADGVLIKPFEAEQLLETVRHFIGS